MQKYNNTAQTYIETYVKTTVGLSQMAIFQYFRSLFLQKFTDKANNIVQYYFVPCRLFVDPKHWPQIVSDSTILISDKSVTHRCTEFEK